MAFLLLTSLCCIGMAAVLSPPTDAPKRPEPKSADLRAKFARWGLDIKRQGPRGTCSVFTVVGALEYALSKKQGSGVRLSEEFLNWASNKAMDDYHDGGFFHDLWTGFEKYGVCLEHYLPYSTAFDPNLQPPEEALQSAKTALAKGIRLHWIKRWDVKTGLSEEEFARIAAMLRKGWPVCGGFRWPKKAEWQEGVLGMCPASEVFDGHSVLLVGYQDDTAQPDGGLFFFRDSGSGRYSAMPYAYAKEFMNDAAWIDY